MGKSIIIADSSPLIALAIIGRLELLKNLHRQVWVPPAVWDEIVINGKGLPGSESVGNLTWLEIHEPDRTVLRILTLLVDRGEAEAIALAQSIPDSTVILDDAKARRVAEHFGIQRNRMGLIRHITDGIGQFPL